MSCTVSAGIPEGSVIMSALHLIWIIPLAFNLGYIVSGILADNDKIGLSPTYANALRDAKTEIARLKSDLTGTAFALSDHSAENIQLKEEIARLKLLSVRCCRCNSKIKVSQATDCPVCKQKQSDISISDQMDNSYGRF